MTTVQTLSHYAGLAFPILAGINMIALLVFAVRKRERDEQNNAP